MNKDIDKKILSDITIYAKYARYVPELKRRETWDEIVDRNIDMHVKKFPHLEIEIREVYNRSVRTKKLLPSARSLQFAGRAIEVNPCRIYNCAYAPVNHPDVFSEASFLLLGGSGFGYSVQNKHISQLPTILGVEKPTGHKTKKRYLIGDSIEGWSDAFKVLVESYFYGKREIDFDFREIRKKGTRLVTAGGKAPGPEPLRKALVNVVAIFETALQERGVGTQLTSLEVHDIICTIADAVRSGGIRRSACISLFDNNDEAMLNCKKGEWWVHHPQRALANNSAIMPYADVTEEQFSKVWKAIELSGSGEPGISWTNNPDLGFNPCKPLYSKILTEKGYITFEQALNMESLNVVYNGGIYPATKPFKTGENREIWAVQLSNGSYLYGTDNHQHRLVGGNWKRMDELVIGDKLMAEYNPIHTTSIDNADRYNAGIFSGWLWGDGSLAKRSDCRAGHTLTLAFGINEKDAIPFFEETYGIKTKPHGQKPDTCSVFSTHNSKYANYVLDEGYSLSKDDLTWLYGKDKSYKLGFIKSAFTTDGSVRLKNRAVELYSIHRESLSVLSDILREFGIASTVTCHSIAKKYITKDGKVRNNKQTYKLCIYGGAYKQIGFLCAYKQDLLDTMVEYTSKVSKEFLTVVDINAEYDIQDVYDITVDHPDHSFIDSGIVTHNCHEVSLKPFSFCNLTEINGSIITTQDEFNQVAKDASFIGTLQASYTNFHYLRSIWKETTEADALIGVGITGIATASLLDLDEQLSAEVVILENERVAKLIGINRAQRTTVVKPAGTTSLIFSCSSGIHAWHNDYYIRRVTLGKDESIAKFLMLFHPELVEESEYDTKEIKVCVPQKAPEGAMIRTESVFETLERVKRFNRNWVQAGHVDGDNFNNVSTTISVMDNEWESVGKWMWENRENYLGIAVLPYHGGSYRQAPFEDITKEQYEERLQHLIDVDLSVIIEEDDETDLVGEIACAGGACEVK